MSEIKTKNAIELSNQIKYVPRSSKTLPLPPVFNLPKDVKNSIPIERKKTLLKKLRSKTKLNSYKRYLGTPLRYAGGKSLAVGHIINLLPSNTKRVISPFLGGASVEIAIAKELHIEVIGYDIFDILINYWHYQINEPKKLANKLKKFNPTKEEYSRVKEIMKNH
jgi:DNA adenine methylase